MAEVLLVANMYFIAESLCTVSCELQAMHIILASELLMPDTIHECIIYSNPLSILMGKSDNAGSNRRMEENKTTASSGSILVVQFVCVPG